MKKALAVISVLFVAGVGFAASQPNQKVVAFPPVEVTCDTDPAAGPFYEPGADVVRYDVWNTSAKDICIAFCGNTTPSGSNTCVGGAADVTSLESCSFVLGAYAGSGTPDVWTVGGTLDTENSPTVSTFECDIASGTGKLAITEWRRVR